MDNITKLKTRLLSRWRRVRISTTGERLYDTKVGIRHQYRRTDQLTLGVEYRCSCGKSIPAQMTQRRLLQDWFRNG